MISVVWFTQYSFEREHKLAYATRCIRVHAGKHAAESLQETGFFNTNDTIVWKHYVKGNGKVGRKTLPALDHLIDARTKGRNVIQIIGEGGLGKTKLTIDSSNTVWKQRPWSIVLMLTAKSPEQGEWNTSFSSFRQEGLLSPRPTLAFGHYVPDMDYDKVMDYIYDLVDVENTGKISDEGVTKEILIILDNFEDASQPVAEKFYDHFFEKVDELPECKSKIIITGRTWRCIKI